LAPRCICATDAAKGKLRSISTPSSI